MTKKCRVFRLCATKNAPVSAQADGAATIPTAPVDLEQALPQRGRAEEASDGSVPVETKFGQVRCAVGEGTHQRRCGRVAVWNRGNESETTCQSTLVCPRGSPRAPLRRHAAKRSEESGQPEESWLGPVREGTTHPASTGRLAHLHVCSGSTCLRERRPARGRQQNKLRVRDATTRASLRVERHVSPPVRPSQVVRFLSAPRCQARGDARACRSWPARAQAALRSGLWTEEKAWWLRRTNLRKTNVMC